jgi:hypothetical protein
MLNHLVMLCLCWLVSHCGAFVLPRIHRIQILAVSIDTEGISGKSNDTLLYLYTRDIERRLSYSQDKELVRAQKSFDEFRRDNKESVKELKKDIKEFFEGLNGKVGYYKLRCCSIQNR